MDSSSQLAANFQSNCTMTPPPEDSTSGNQEAFQESHPSNLVEDQNTHNQDDQNTSKHLAMCQENDEEHGTFQADGKHETSPPPKEGGNQSNEDTQEKKDRLDDEDLERLVDEEEDDFDAVMPSFLLTLPPELIWCILEFLDARFVIKQVSSVCKQLHELVNKDVTWKVRISKRWPKRYPIIPVDDDEFNWKLACIQREEQHRMWANHEVTMESFCLNMGHFAAVDSVHLFQEGTMCISGSRDRTMQIWDLKKLDSAEPKKSVEASKVKSITAHKGWIWHITSKDNYLISSSWDCWIKLWDMERECTEIRKIRGKSAFLSTVFLPDVIISGSYDKMIYIHDHRADDPVVDKLRYHTKPVLSVAADSKYIISGSEDKTIAIYDRQAGKLFKQIKLESFSMGMSYGFNQLWTGQKDGTLHILDPTHGNFNVVETYDSGHKGKVTDVIHNLGAVITCSTDKTVKVHEPNHDPAVVTTHSDFTGDLAGLHLQNNVLASACSDSTVGIWRPVTQ